MAGHSQQPDFGFEKLLLVDETGEQYLSLAALRDRVTDCDDFGVDTAVSNLVIKTSVASLKTAIAAALVKTTRFIVAYCKCRYIRALNLTSFAPRVPKRSICLCNRIAISMSSLSATQLTIAAGFDDFEHNLMA